MRPIVGIIPSLGTNEDRLNSCIQSINQQSLRSLVHLVVVDNSRNSLLRNLNGVDEVLTPKCNLGYNAAIEYARRRYPSEYLWLLQDDLVVHENALVNLIERMNADERLGCVSPKAVRGNFLPMGVRAGYFTNSSRTQYRSLIAKETSDGFPKDKEIAWVSGSGALYRGSALVEIGGINLQLYPVQGTDVNLSLRLIIAGWKIDLEPNSCISHRINGSTPNTLKKLLAQQHDRVNRKMLQNLAYSEDYESDIDLDILSAVAVRSSYLLVELSQQSQDRIFELEKQVEELTAQLIK